VLRTYGARQAPSPQRRTHRGVPASTQTSSSGATPGGVDASPGREGPGAAAVLCHEVRTRRASDRSRGPAAFREALPQADVVLLTAEVRAVAVLQRLFSAALKASIVPAAAASSAARNLAPNRHNKKNREGVFSHRSHRCATDRTPPAGGRFRGGGGGRSGRLSTFARSHAAARAGLELVEDGNLAVDPAVRLAPRARCSHVAPPPTRGARGTGTALTAEGTTLRWRPCDAGAGQGTGKRVNGRRTLCEPPGFPCAALARRRHPARA
jgi:hypothetical protein